MRAGVGGAAGRELRRTRCAATGKPFAAPFFRRSVVDVEMMRETDLL